jgi:uncharacterized damage-inducible protein DinB
MDVLKMLDDRQLEFAVGRNMGTLGEQFRHMARIQRQYTEALETKKIAPATEKIDSFVAKSKRRLIELSDAIDQKMLRLLENMSDEELERLRIDWTHWGANSMDIYSHLQALIDHENLHCGQIVVYLRTMGLKFPESWKAWGYNSGVDLRRSGLFRGYRESGLRPEASRLV